MSRMMHTGNDHLMPVAIARRRIGRALEKLPDAPMVDAGHRPGANLRAGYRIMAVLSALVTLSVLGNLVYSTGAGVHAGLLNLHKTIRPGLVVRCTMCGATQYNVKSMSEAREIIGDGNGICFSCHTVGHLAVFTTCAECGFTVRAANAQAGTAGGEFKKGGEYQSPCPACGCAIPAR